MKRVIIIFSVLIGLVLITMILVPILFKDDIQEALDTELDNSLNARVFYDADQFSLSLFRQFPNLSVAMGDFGIVGIEAFADDTLVAVGSFEVTIDLMSAISGEQVVIRKILLDQPRIHVIVLEDGRANYDIAKASEEPEVVDETPVDTTSSAVSVAISSWEIREGSLIYDDRAGSTNVLLGEINHVGGGDFSQDVFDMTTMTDIKQITAWYDGVAYLSRKDFAADLTMNMNLAEMLFTFKDNRLALNDFGFGFDGMVSMPGDDITMDITFEGQEIDLKSILSLIPGAYQEYLDGITAGGEIGFSGLVKGTYNETTMPQVSANLSVQNGTIRYAEYPIPIEELNVAAGFDYPSADLSDFSFEMTNFSVLVDGERTTAMLLLEDLEDYFWDFQMEGNLDLEKITKIIPLEDMELKGKINATLGTSGRMSALEAERYAELPTSGSMAIAGFSYVSPDLPQGFGIASSEMTFDPSAITLKTFQGNAGKTDLNLSGQITNYLDFALSETGVLSADFDFKSKIVNVDEWMVPDDSTVSEEPVADESLAAEDTAAVETPRIPTNIDFVLTSQIDEIVYDNLNLKGFVGEVVIRNGALLLEKVNFGLLDGDIEMYGSYETLPEDPLYSFDLIVNKMSIPSAYKAFGMVEQLAPFAEKMQGDFSSEFQIGGSLMADMSPNYNDIRGLGLLNIANASLQDVKLLSLASGFKTGVNAFEGNDGSVSLKDVLMQVTIEEGRVNVKPFSIKLGGYSTRIEGSNGVMGDLDYSMTVLDVETGAAGQAINSLVSSTLGVGGAVASNVDIALGVGGTFTEPKVQFRSLKPSAGQSSAISTAAVKAQAEQELEKAKQQALEEAEKRKAEAEQLAAEKRAEAEKRIAEEKAALEKRLEEEKKAAESQLKDELKDVTDKIKLPFGKKKKKNN
ncbi:MAG: AsmA-like C-terminal region-containing protein [Bacteroidota bacterium]